MAGMFLLFLSQEFVGVGEGEREREICQKGKGGAGEGWSELGTHLRVIRS